MTDTCPSCGVPYTEHDGFIGVCRDLQEAIEIVSDLGERDPCRLDHHGYCQEHDWFDASPCPHKRAKEFLAKMDENAKRRRDAGQLMRGME
jgi:uncharacterized Zn finger protein (UPF0148 family)